MGEELYMTDLPGGPPGGLGPADTEPLPGAPAVLAAVDAKDLAGLPSTLSAAGSPPPARRSEEFWDQAAWAEPLRRFSQVTQLSVAAYDTAGARRAGPYFDQPLAAMLHEAHHWGPRGVATRIEQRLARRAARGGRRLKIRVCGTLLLAAMPVRGEAQEVAGVVIFGWVLGTFADPLACERLARRFGLKSMPLWQTARQCAPVSAHKLRTYSRLLETLLLSIAYRVTSVAALQEASRAKDTFLATVSHELRTPLTAMLLRAQGLKRSQRLTHDRDQRALAVILQSAAIQQKLIEDLLDASRSIAGKLTLEVTRCDVAACLRAALDVVSTAATAKNIALVADILPDSVLCQADPVRLQQLFWNLLGNAVKFTPSDGRVEVVLRTPQGRAEVRVTDSGRGIEPSFLPKVFDRFAQAGERVREQERGLGLGLAISKYIVELHGGTIAVASGGLGQGAIFTVTLPC